MKMASGEVTQAIAVMGSQSSVYRIYTDCRLLEYIKKCLEPENLTPSVLAKLTALWPGHLLLLAWTIEGGTISHH